MDLPESARRTDVSSRGPPRTPAAYRIADGITEGLLYFMVVFAPWAFGTTEPWSIWTMNISGCVVGALLITKWVIRARTGFRPARWGEEGGVRRDGTTVLLAGLTVVILLWCLVSAINARSTFYYRTRAFEPHEFISWLPHSFDSYATWQAFWQYLGLAFTFWAARDWLLGKTAGERRESRDAASRETAARAGSGTFPLPARLQRLLWVLCLNGALLALEALLQRLSGTGELLWLVQPVFSQTADVQFGPFAYRSNAAQYFNLVWPVCLGFWWSLREHYKGTRGTSNRAGGGPHLVLLPCAVLLAAAPIISTSRGGALVAGAMIVIALAVLLFASRRRRWTSRLGIVAVFVVTLGLAGYFGWSKLQHRLRTIFTDELSGRVELYRNAREIAEDYPVLGTGPGTFPWVYHLYRTDPRATWEAYAHDDWLETRITFGWVGFAMVLTMLLLVPVRPLTGRGLVVRRVFAVMLWLALFGCLAHARFDFPFQIYSTLGLFLHLCAILFCLGRRR